MGIEKELIGPLLLAYLIGSIPFAYILGQLILGLDVRKIGSGNVGATNALRTGNKAVAALTLIFDVLKGYTAVSFVHFLIPTLPLLLIGLLCVLGHIFPIWLRFQGGKGVAPMLGVCLATSLYASAALVAVWVIVFSLKRYASLASMITALLFPLFIYSFSPCEELKYAIALMVLVGACHFKNLQRLFRGDELSV